MDADHMHPPGLSLPVISCYLPVCRPFHNVVVNIAGFISNKEVLRIDLNTRIVGVSGGTSCTYWLLADACNRVRPR